TATFPARGVVSELTVRIRAAGRPGLVWWVKSQTVPVEPCTVAPALAGPGASVLTVPQSQALDVLATVASRSAPGELDGVRAWRDGDSERAVHWPTSLRTGELVVHDQRGGPPECVLVRAAPAPPDPDEEAGRVRWALERALRAGDDVWAAVGDGDPVPIPNATAAATWTATCDLGAKGRRRRRWSVSRPTFEPTDVPAAGRWWTAAAAWVAVAMLVGALAWPSVLLPLLGGAIAFGAWTGLRHPPSTGAAPAWQRSGVALIALAGLASIAARSGGITGLLALLRGPMPEFLVLLVVLHGVEARDRRTVRVHLAVSAVVAAYATGLRVDSAVGPWLAAWCTCFGVGLVATGTLVTVRRPRPSERVGTVAVVAGALAATVALLAVVPVPDGPARLTLPAFIDEIRTVGAPGALARPDGALAGAGIGTGSRGIADESGAYEGFTEALDTSVRGDLGDDVVMRVRAPEPDFWRGQTFADFDGRVWTADPDVGQLRDGPDIDVPPAFGDARVQPGDRERFVQTFFVESDLPNVIFAASRPRRLIFEGGVWVRPDGSLRTDVVLT
ncbi:MAG TPA: transglutaminaseTgpA domain-containing protein, partial [Ilumatobacteraceae bacterium]